MLNSHTVLTWSSKRLLVICFFLSFLYFFCHQVTENTQVPDYANQITTDASSTIFQNGLITEALGTDSIVKSLAEKHDAFVYVVNIHGLMLYASTPSTHQFNDLKILDKLTFQPEVSVFKNKDHATGKHFIRCYLPYDTPELPTEKTFLIIDKSFYTSNPYTSAIAPALQSSLLSSLIIVLLYALMIAKPVAKQVRTIQDSFAPSDEEHPSYNGIPELMKIRQTQDLLYKKNRSSHQKLSTQIQYWESFFNAIPAGLIIVDQDNSIINANRQSFELFKAPQILKAKGSFLMAAYKNSELSRLSSDFIATEKEFQETEMQVFRQGEERNLNLKLVKIPLNNKSEHGLIIVINDITHIRQLENLRKEFVSNVSHELKTPITVTLGFLEALEDCLDDPTQSAYFFKIIKRNTHRLNNIIQDLLTLSRLETHEKMKHFGYDSRDIMSTLQNTLELTSEEAKEKNAIITSHIYSKQIKANHGLIELAVRNLLENAIRYSDSKNAEVSLTLSENDEVISIKIDDNGPGIPVQFQERIFQRFFRIDESRDRNTGGSGLGLSIVKHIIQLHEGSISVDSSVGRGSSFTLRIPK
jgi:two-component system, OmpR family, phosphate regulon sensor histidine kinase PhoR